MSNKRISANQAVVDYLNARAKAIVRRELGEVYWNPESVEACERVLAQDGAVREDDGGSDVDAVVYRLVDGTYVLLWTQAAGHFRPFTSGGVGIAEYVEE